MRWALALVVLATVSLAASAMAADANLRLGEEFRLGEATLAMGHLDPGPSPLSDVHAVDVDRLVLPTGTLYVCADEGGRRDEVPPIPTLQDRCRGEDTYEDARVTVGDRTWLVLAGNLTMRDPPNASTTALLVGPEGGLGLAGVTHGAMEAEVDGEMAFRPQLPASQIRVETPDDEQTYNGTEWVFYLQASGSARLAADGLYLEVPLPASLSLTPAGTPAMREALDARTLLDLQSAALGPDQREPVANATRLVGSATRLPPLVDGALLGHLNGTVGDRRFEPGEPSLLGLSRLEADVEAGELSGSLDARFVRTDAGVAPGLGQPAGVPWIGVLLSWALAGVSIAIGPAAVTRRLRDRLLAAGAFSLALLAWDRILASALGTSALSAWTGEAGLGVGLTLGAFEAIAFGLAWLLLAWPLRLVGERWLADPAARRLSPVASLGLLVFAWVSPGAIVSVGRLVARF